MCNIRWKYAYGQVQSGFTCNCGSAEVFIPAQTPMSDSEGKARRKYPTAAARILSAQDWEVIVLSSSWYDKLNCEKYCYASTAADEVGL